MLAALLFVLAAAWTPGPTPPAEFREGVMQGERILSGSITAVLADYDLGIFGSDFAALPDELRHCRVVVLKTAAEEIAVNCYMDVSPCELGQAGRYLVLPIVFVYDGYPKIHYALTGFTAGEPRQARPPVTP